MTVRRTVDKAVTTIAAIIVMDAVGMVIPRVMQKQQNVDGKTVNHPGDVAITAITAVMETAVVMVVHKDMDLPMEIMIVVVVIQTAAETTIMITEEEMARDGLVILKDTPKLQSADGKEEVETAVVHMVVIPMAVDLPITEGTAAVVTGAVIVMRMMITAVVTNAVVVMTRMIMSVARDADGTAIPKDMLKQLNADGKTVDTKLNFKKSNRPGSGRFDFYSSNN